jgi:hypothetical protein
MEGWRSDGGAAPGRRLIQLLLRRSAICVRRDREADPDAAARLTGRSRDRALPTRSTHNVDGVAVIDCIPIATRTHPVETRDSVIEAIIDWRGPFRAWPAQ